MINLEKGKYTYVYCFQLKYQCHEKEMNNNEIIITKFEYLVHENSKFFTQKIILYLFLLMVILLFAQFKLEKKLSTLRSVSKTLRWICI